MKRFVVSSEKTLGAVLQKLAVDPRWLAEGRVFVGPVRAKREDHTLRPGDEVRIEEPSQGGANVASAPPMPPILFEDEDLCVVHKPAGISTIGDQKSEADSLRGLVAAYRTCETDHVHATSRLDRLVSGIVTFTLTKNARDALALAREQGTYRRRYFAIGSVAANARGAEPKVAPVWDAPIGRAKNSRLRMIRGKDATSAKTHATLAAFTQEAALLALEPQTGRTHQLRLHAAHAGLPLFGDKDYGGPIVHSDADGRVVPLRRIALHAAIVRFPYRGSELTVQAPVGDELLALWKSLGGVEEAWNTLGTCAVPSSCDR